MGFNNKTYKALKNLTMLTQLALSLLTPTLLCIFGAIWLKNKFGLGQWIVMLGIFLGLGSGVQSVYTFAKQFMKEADKSQKEYEDQFN